jgi:hypothetical protein
MTVHWNSRKGFAEELKTSSTARELPDDQDHRMTLPEMLWAVRKVPETRAAVIARGKALLQDPGYPPQEVVKQIADLMARHWDHPPQA